ncbi:hypothetical protein [Mucilaginibacter sp. UYCu711]|uniref:hypothetical protein n=1 Tax=Mucilaginibacter sp. UYCu711 TaxID=3156339 RepID=UPI003D228962
MKAKNTHILYIMAIKIEPVYMTVAVSGKAWDKTEQIFLGVIPWDKAVTIAKQQSNKVRLCTSPGYSNQGHYFQPEKI